MIGYYIHHQGRGHLERAAAIARALGTEVAALSSLPRPGDITPFAQWVELDRDDRDPSARDHTANATLHWAPLESPGYRARVRRLASWLDTAAPDLVVVDVSVEITALCRLLGVPVVVMAGAGRRHDGPHQLAYGLAERIVAPWPGDLYRPDHLDAFAQRTHFAGAMSRFDGRDAGDPPGRQNVFVLFGAGGTDIDAAQLAAARDATPDWRWTAPLLDGTAWCADVWDQLCAADVVVTHAGMNALAEVAAARRAAVVIPQDRPFDEQAVTAGVLREHGLATVLDRWPAAHEWPRVLSSAAGTGGGRWVRWNDGRAAGRAADFVIGAVHRAREAAGVA